MFYPARKLGYVSTLGRDLNPAIGIESSPLPETVTAVRSLRLLGGCFTVGVAEARAVRTERRTAVFMVNQFVELASQRVD